MPKIKLDKYEVYTLIAENLNWFPTQKYYFIGGDYEAPRRLTCSEIESRINRKLQKDYDETFTDSDYDPPYIKLYGSTLTAMVYDGVLARDRDSSKEPYLYWPVLPINEDYAA